SRRRHTRFSRDWSSDVCSSDLSITTGFDTCRVLADCPEASWATGTDAGVDSLAMRLLGDETAVTERAWNYAEAGATVSGLAAQADRKSVVQGRGEETVGEGAGE